MNNFIDKINISNIISDHLSTLKSLNGKSFIWNDIILFFITPILFSLALEIFGVKVDFNFSTLLIAVYSLFAGLLFNLLIFVFDIISKINKLDIPVRVASLRLECFKEISFNTSFEILICLFSIVIVLFSNLIKVVYLEKIFSFLIFYTIILFVLNLFLILKSVHKLLDREIDAQNTLVRTRAKEEGEVLPW